jgi:cytochrome c oxidase cbb3-type subunit IV
MSALWGHFVGVVIALLMVSFVGIWIWAWLPHHRDTFAAHSRIPLHDDDLPAADDPR